jgi:anion-transporting  ArsA/GET3 family ATPase
MKSLSEVVEGHGVVICAGSGGVGKTTTAAALGLHAAERGRRTIVLTIDPARRLADALGLRDLGNEAREVGIGAKGMLSAMMLDQKGAWDQLVERYAPSPEVRDRILANRFYQNLSQSFAGSQEYMAVEQLSELHQSGRYDLIVVDTPPTRHALDFLDAPQRIADFLDRQVVRWFVKPYFSAGWATLRTVNRTIGALFRRLEDATGVTALVEVSDFFVSMSALFDGFEERVQRVNRLLQSEETAFVLIASPDEQVLTEAEYFCRKVDELSVRLRAVVFNRVHLESAAARRGVDPAALTRMLARVIGAEQARRLAENFVRYETLARGDNLRLEAFRRQLPRRTIVATVPNFDEDLHDLSGLRRMIPHLVGA